MCSFIFNISVFPQTKATCDKEFYHYFYSDILCVCVCVCVCVWPCRVSKTEIVLKLFADSIYRAVQGWVCGRSIAGSVGSNPAGDMDFRVLRLLYVVR